MLPREQLTCSSVMAAAFRKFRTLKTSVLISTKPLLFLVIFCYSMGQGAYMILLLYTTDELGWSSLTNGL